MDDRVAICLLIGEVLTADGMMMPPERELLEQAMDAVGLGPDERARVHDMKDDLEEAEKIVRALPVERRREVMDRLLEAALSDGRVSHHETDTIRRITVALGL
jgi:uncharacterized tellurite resistance protein B-like protein